LAELIPVLGDRIAREKLPEFLVCLAARARQWRIV
jgi:hypothetical protein